MFNKVILCPGGNLISDERRYNEETEEWTDFSRDLTEKAHSFLHQKVTFDGCRVGDIYELLKRDPILTQVFRENFTESFLKHLETQDLSILEEKYNLDNKNGEGFQKVIIEKKIAFDEVNYLIDGLHVFALSHKLKKKTKTGKVGEQVSYGLLGCPIEDLYFVPIEYNPEVLVIYNRSVISRDGSNRGNFTIDNLTLYELIFAITYELSFWGSPEDSKKEVEKLKEAHEEAKQLIAKRKTKLKEARV